MALVKKNFRAELPSDWAPHIRDCRQKPSPYVVEEVDNSFWRSWTGPVPISNEKYTDVVDLSRFCNNILAKDCFLNLPHNDEARKKREHRKKRSG
ncbi:hypothetical protein J6590_068633 [Homalodisca vitripennis]|nr:hypothetical protein J6590_068633 [Homalodisca vitripennis]